MKDYYRILEIHYQSSHGDIESAYQLACDSMAYQEAATRFLIDEAYSVLSDSKKRKEYDLELYQYAQISPTSDMTNDSDILVVEDEFDYYKGDVFDADYKNRNDLDVDTIGETNTKSAAGDHSIKWKYRYGIIVVSMLGLFLVYFG